MLLDPNASWMIAAETMPGRAGNTPFDGLPVQGKVRRLFKGGASLL
jgi:dihydroorotase